MNREETNKKHDDAIIKKDKQIDYLLDENLDNLLHRLEITNDDEERNKIEEKIKLNAEMRE